MSCHAPTETQHYAYYSCMGWLRLERILVQFHACPSTIAALCLCQSHMGHLRGNWVKMALVIGLPIRRCRLKIPNLTQFTRSFNSSASIKRAIGRNDRYWYLIGGSLVAFTYAKWHRLGTVQAFNPKKIKVSERWKKIKYHIINTNNNNDDDDSRRRIRRQYRNEWVIFVSVIHIDWPNSFWVQWVFRVKRNTMREFDLCAKQ